MVTLLGLHPAGTPKYDKPVNYAGGLQTYVKPVDQSQAGAVWVQVNDSRPTYDEIRLEALYNCKNNKSPSVATIKLVDELIMIEKKYNVPASLRGMLLSAACIESGFNSNARGDYRKSKKSKRLKPKAIGILQQWPWAEKFYNIDRTSPLQAADAWMKHVTRQLKSVKRECRPRSKKKQWVAAWVKSIRAPKKDGNRCKERPTHYRLLKKWHRIIMRDRKANEEFGC
tara:strand:- start:733 stop:1413 length:681 start_codon:yes stop_codon:yes gene_type:complete